MGVVFDPLKTYLIHIRFANMPTMIYVTCYLLYICYSCYVNKCLVAQKCSCSLIRNFRDKGQIACLGRQLYPGYKKAFMDALYDRALRAPEPSRGYQVNKHI